MRRGRVHIGGQNDMLVKTEPLLLLEEEIKTFRKYERTGRPLEEDIFIERIERQLCREFRRQKLALKHTSQLQ